MQEMRPIKIPYILLVESDPELALTLQQALKERKLFTLLALTGQEALRITMSIIPALIVIDTRLLDGDGVRLYDQLLLRRHLQDIPTILLNTTIENNEQRLEKRGVVVLSLPFELDDFYQTIKAYLPVHLV